MAENPWFVGGFLKELLEEDDKIKAFQWPVEGRACPETEFETQ